MSTKPRAVDALPRAVTDSLVTLGQGLRIARKRRKMTLAEAATRLQVSVPTLRRMERGDPSVSVGVYAMSLWLIGKVDLLGKLADPAFDMDALVIDVQGILTGHRGR